MSDKVQRGIVRLNAEHWNGNERSEKIVARVIGDGGQISEPRLASNGTLSVEFTLDHPYLTDADPDNLPVYNWHVQYGPGEQMFFQFERMS